jgi:hypothetical protein
MTDAEIREALALQRAQTVVVGRVTSAPVSRNRAEGGGLSAPSPNKDEMVPFASARSYFKANLARLHVPQLAACRRDRD